MKIALLPQDVVDRIAAGEVVQRPASAVKELMENSIDAGATDILVQTNGTDQLTISDNGCGIDPIDLQLAAARHATSKLQTSEDLSSIVSFGFRGEALASISMVSHLSITSKTDAYPAAYKLSYMDGKPTTDQPMPTARRKGTTVHVQDLFYNMSHRKVSMRQSDEYNAILKILQLYSIHYASSGIAFHCQKMAGANKNSKSSASKTDLNTSTVVIPVRNLLQQKNSADSGTSIHQQLKEQQLLATKNVIMQAFGSQLFPYLKEFTSELIRDGNRANDTSLNNIAIDEGAPGVGILKDTTNKPGENEFVYSCHGILSSPSYQSTKGIQFILFVNNRYVDGCLSLKRTIESVYSEFANKSKPFVYLSLNIPPHEVDVNVHPSKREVALLHLDDICNHLAAQLRQTLSLHGQSFSINSQNTSIHHNPYDTNRKRKQTTLLENSATSDNVQSQDSTIQAPTPSQRHQVKIAPNKFIRTSRSTAAGSLVPFLVSTQQQQQSAEASQQSSSPQQQSSLYPPQKVNHKPDCPLLLALDDNTKNPTLDLTVPGAFASIAKQCTCNQPMLMESSDTSLSPAGTIRLPRQVFQRPKNRLPHPCSYKSILSLRKRIQTQTDTTVQQKLRSSCFVGVVSHCRSLVQCGEELVLLNHYECLREMFYQLALKRFGSGDVATFGGDDNNCGGGNSGIDIVTAISQIVQVEENLSHDPNNYDVLQPLEMATPSPTKEFTPVRVSSTNKTLAEQASQYLLEQSEMLKEYFSICIEKRDNNRIVLIGLPLLLDGYEPSMHGIPLFLLRLATEVDWNDEKSCFYGVCQEIASFYAQLPSGDDHYAFVRHTVFPAVSTLLYPPKDFKEKNNFMTVASLSGLYRVFERC